MADPLTETRDGQTIHWSVGALIEREGKVLLIDRAQFPFGMAGPAGHIDEDEAPEQAVVREVEEETGLKVTKCHKVIDEFVPWNECSKGIKGHHWYVYRCEVEGELKRDQRETKSIG